MMHAPRSSASALILGGEDMERLVSAALQELHVSIDRLEEPEDFGRTRRPADLVLLERERLSGPETLRHWIESEIVDPAVPLLLLAPSPFGPSEYREWLSAGAWDVVRLPIDPAILSLRLRNILGGRLDKQGASLTPHRPYPWPTLVRATAEVMALSRRHNRPVACVALAVEPIQGEGGSPRLMSRLGVAAREWTRDSDLVGLTEQDVLLVVLPDTTEEYAEVLGPRLMAALQRSLHRAGTVAALRSATRVASLDDSESADEFLLAAVRQVT